MANKVSIDFWLAITLIFSLLALFFATPPYSHIDRDVMKRMNAEFRSAYNQLKDYSLDSESHFLTLEKHDRMLLPNTLIEDMEHKTVINELSIKRRSFLERKLQSGFFLYFLFVAAFCFFLIRWSNDDILKEKYARLYRYVVVAIICAPGILFAKADLFKITKEIPDAEKTRIFFFNNKLYLFRPLVINETHLDYSNLTQLTDDEFFRLLESKQYDPTNGTFSPGLFIYPELKHSSEEKINGPDVF